MNASALRARLGLRPPPAGGVWSPATMGRLGAWLLAVLAAMAIFAPLLARHDPRAAVAPPYQAPGTSYWLGTDDVGHDLFAQLVHGARISLTIGVLSALLAVALGLAVALAAGYLRGPVEALLMRLVDLALSLPFFVLVIVLAAFFGRGLSTTVIVIAAVIWARPARVLRSQVIKVREFQHVVAAQAMGASPGRVVGRHILPRIAPLAMSQFVRAANVAVLIEASLAFLGLGDPAHVSWGTTLYFANERSAFLTDTWVWWILPPGLALTAAVVGFAFVGYAIEEWADPRLSAPPGGPRAGGARERDAAAPPAVAAPGAALDVQELVVEYSGAAQTVRAVDGVSFTVRPGKVLGLVGESGSGKSTIALALLRLVRSPGRVVQGAVLLNGRDLQRLAPAEVVAVRGREAALVPQTAMNALNPAYTVHRQVAEAAALLPREPEAADARAHALLELVGIGSERHGAYPHELSGGMRQRVVIAMAIANEPGLVVADEPVTGLDVVTQARILGLLRELQDRLGFALVLISHDLPLVARLADELVVLRDGHVVEHGAAAAVSAAPRDPYTRALLAPLQHRRAVPGAGEATRALTPRMPDAAVAARPGDDPVVELRDVCKAFRRPGRRHAREHSVVAADEVTLSVAAGEIVALVGESGAGKSTLGRIVVGLERPDSGHVRFEGHDLTRLRGRSLRRLRARMHLILQDPYGSLHPGMRVAVAVAEPLAIHGIGARERERRAMAALEEVGLGPASAYARRFPHELSGGQRQRVAMARALVGQPRIVVADEPTSMVDAPLRAGILDLVLAMRARISTAFVLITHDLAVARYASDRVVVMEHGRIVESGPTERVITRPAHEHTRTLLAASEGVLPEVRGCVG